MASLRICLRAVRAHTAGLLLPLVAVLLGTTVALAAAADLDTRINRSGIVVTDINGYDEANAVLVTPRGKVVAVGGTVTDAGDNDIVLVRYGRGGVLDRTFGVGGIVTTDIAAVGTSLDWAYAAALQADGKIVVAGSTNLNGDLDAFVARYTARGALDPTFGTAGVVVTDLTAADRDDEARDVAILGDGTIVVAARAENESSKLEPTVARFLPNGTLDTSFGDGDDGITRLNVGTLLSMETSAMAVQSDGKLVLAGTVTQPGAPIVRDFGVVRFGTDGLADGSFGTDGVVVQDLLVGTFVHEDAYDVGIQTIGGGERILVVGQIQSPGSEVNLVMARFTSSGALDTSFDTDGVLIQDLVGADSGRTLAIRPDGSFVVAGSSFTGVYAFQISFHLASGALDTSGGSTGWATAQSGYDSLGSATAFAPDGGVVVAGRTKASMYAEMNVAVLRFLAA